MLVDLTDSSRSRTSWRVRWPTLNERLFSWRSDRGDSPSSVVQTDYSLLNRAPEADFLPYCQDGIAVMVRGPLARGLLAGRYTTESTFDDPVRISWNKEGPAREKFLQQVAQVQKLAGVVKPGQELVRAAIAYTFSHPAISVTIPGAKSAEQARMNAEAGESLLTDAERKMLVNAVS